MSLTPNSLNQQQKSQYPFHATKINKPLKVVINQSPNNELKQKLINITTNNKAVQIQSIDDQYGIKYQDSEMKTQFTFGNNSSTLRLPFLSTPKNRGKIDVHNIILNLSQPKTQRNKLKILDQSIVGSRYNQSVLQVKDYQEYLEQQNMSQYNNHTQIYPENTDKNDQQMLSQLSPKAQRNLKPYKHQKLYFDKELMFRRDSQKRKRNYTEQYYKTRTQENSDRYLNQVQNQVNEIQVIQDDKIHKNVETAQKSKPVDYALINMTKILDLDESYDSGLQTTKNFVKDELMIESGIDERFKFLLKDKARNPSLKQMSLDQSSILTKIRERYLQNYQIMPIYNTSDPQTQMLQEAGLINNSSISTLNFKNQSSKISISPTNYNRQSKFSLANKSNNNLDSSMTSNQKSKTSLIDQSRFYLPSKYSLTPKIRTADDEYYTQILSNSNLILPQIYNPNLFKKVYESNRKQEHKSNNDNDQVDLKEEPKIQLEINENEEKLKQMELQKQSPSQNANKSPKPQNPFTNKKQTQADRILEISASLLSEPRYLRVRPSIDLERDNELIKQTLKPNFKRNSQQFNNSNEQQQNNHQGKVRKLQYTDMANYFNDNKDRRKNKSIKEKSNEETSQILRKMFNV